MACHIVMKGIQGIDQTRRDQLNRGSTGSFLALPQGKRAYPVRLGLGCISHRFRVSEVKLAGTRRRFAIEVGVGEDRGSWLDPGCHLPLIEGSLSQEAPPVVWMG